VARRSSIPRKGPGLNPVFLLLLQTAVLLLLAGCGGVFPEPQPAGKTVAGEDAVEHEHLEMVEPEEVLAEELSALRETGVWSDRPLEENAVSREKVIYDFPVMVNRQVELYLDLFQHDQKKYFRRWLARSGRYLPAIQAELARAGLPQDLAYLAMIESGFNPSAYSRARAVGLWQFMRATGRHYGLRIDRWVDERRDPEKATRAAIAYLSALYEEFDDWYLAVAAYNAGEGRIRKAIRKYGTRDFWQLARHRTLRLETKRYVPKLIAAIIIAREPARYGFGDIAYQQPIRCDRVEVPPGTDLAAVAVAAGTSLKEIRLLNNALRRGRTPPGPSSWSVKIPAGDREKVAANLKRLRPVVTTAFKTHVVRRGETLDRICRTYRLNKKTLLKANNLHTARLRRGQRLRIPYRTTRWILLEKGETLSERYARTGRNSPLILHTLKRGETLSRLARQYQVPVSLIMQWNGITDARRIRAGQNIALYVDRPSGMENGTLAEVGNEPGKGSRVLVLSDRKKRRPGSERSPAQLTWYRVKNGDSLWTIARRFRVSARDLKRWNNLRSNLIHPGRRLVIRKS